MKYQYLLAPFFAYLVAGGLKFVINSIKARRLAFKQIGLGGMPSTHISIVSTMVMLVLLNKGVDSAAFGVALTFLAIVFIDARDLRIKVGKQAQLLNQLAEQQGLPARVRERMGHTRLEAIAGLLVGCVCGFILYCL